MTEPNRIAAPGEQAALARVEALTAGLDETRIELFAPSRRAMLDPDTHAVLMAGLLAEADRTGRRELLDDVRDRVTTALMSRFAQRSRWNPSETPVLPIRPDDEAVLVTMIVDAFAVAVMEDRLDALTAARLSDAGRQALGLPSLADPVVPAGGPQVEEPSSEDWADAAAGDTQVGGYSPIPVSLRIVLATITACTVGPAAVFLGVASGSTAAGILAGLAVVAVCWLVATYRR